MDNPDLSLLFYRYICDVIGTEDVVKMRRQILAAYDDLFSDSDTILISSGSKGEGLDLDGSDVDLMYVDIRKIVHENMDHVQPDSCSIVMDVSNCKPGFTQLKKGSPHKCECDGLCDNRGGEQKFSSERYREGMKQYDAVLITHGPCKSTLNGEFDFAYCLKSDAWILQAQSWLSRSRHQWASQNVMDTIVNFGVLFVPIGCKMSPNSDLEWRISFSFAEKLLIWSFNHVQLICYALLKILLKEIIKHSTGELLCSYFLKTIMLWLCEEKKSSQWKPTNVLSCFMSCLDRLIYCVRHRTCVHYFIPENDLFENRFNRQQHSILLSTLIQLRNAGWKCLLQTKTLRSFTNFIHLTTSSDLYCSSYLPFLTLFEPLQMFTQVLSGMSLITNGVFCCLRLQSLNYRICLLSIINQCQGQTLLKENINRDDNKQLYKIYRQGLCHLLIGLNTDAVSGWLLLASFFYVNKQYHVCTRIISDCFVRCTFDKYLVLNKPSRNIETHFELLQRSLKIGPHIFIKKHSIRPVTFESRSQILPKEMCLFEISCDLHVDLPPAAFGLFLKFLCNHHLGNQREKINCLRELNIAAHDEYFMINGSQSDMAHMFLSIANSLIEDNNLHIVCHSYPL